jgi:SET domain-containing protein
MGQIYDACIQHGRFLKFFKNVLLHKRISMILACLFITHTHKMGRGVFTMEDIKADTIIEIAPVIVMTANERKILDQTILHDYIFEWEEEKCCMALGYVPIYNHSYRSNCEYEMDYDLQEINIRAVKDIKAGEELFINYNGDWDNDKPLWFEAK